jgi:hypothetical protein
MLKTQIMNSIQPFRKKVLVLGSNYHQHSNTVPTGVMDILEICAKNYHCGVMKGRGLITNMNPSGQTKFSGYYNQEIES